MCQCFVALLKSMFDSSVQDFHILPGKNSFGSFTEPVNKLEVITYPPKHQPHIVHYVFLDSATVPIVGGVPGYFQGKSL